MHHAAGEGIYDAADNGIGAKKNFKLVVAGSKSGAAISAI
jgi:hypothetical protein